MPEPMFADCVEETLRSLVTTTEAMKAAVEREEFDVLADLLATRETLLARQQDLIEKWRVQAGGDRDRDMVRLGTLMETLKQVDKNFSTLSRAKFDATAERLSQAHNEKLLLAYLQ